MIENIMKKIKDRFHIKKMKKKERKIGYQWHSLKKITEED